jgi:hypothetical protein
LNYGTNPASNDSDSDSLNDKDEIEVYGTNPLSSDSDSDGIPDNEEIYFFNTNPLDADSDGDGLSDGNEVNNIGTDPLHIDTDRDGVNDADDFMPLIDAMLMIQFGFDIDDDLEAPDSYFYFEITPDGAESGCGAGDGDQSICHYTETYYDTYVKVLGTPDLFYLDWTDSESEFTLLIRGWEVDSGWFWNSYEDLDLGPSGTEWISVKLSFSDYDSEYVVLEFESSSEHHLEEGIPTNMSLRLIITEAP